MRLIARRLDADRHLSDRPAWRAILTWPDLQRQAFAFGASEAVDQGLGRYPDPAARVSPAADFEASLAAAWLTRNFSCHYPLRARFLARHRLMPGPLAITEGRCRSFERWARPDDVAGIDVLFVDPTVSDASALFGHVLIRIRYRGGNAADDPVIAYVADAAPGDEGYVLGGLFGAFAARQEVRPWRRIAQRYLAEGGRDISVYRLNLDDTEQRWLLAHLWAHHAGDYRAVYRILSDNCATFAWDTLAAVLPELGQTRAGLAHPHEIVGRLYRAGRATPVERILSHRSRAARAERRRGPRAQALAPALPAILAVEASRWDGPKERAAALDALAREVERTSLSPAASTALARYLDDVIDGADPTVGQAPLAAAMSLRARLPPTTSDRRSVPIPARLQASSSRHVQVSVGTERGGDTTAGISVALIREHAGEGRTVALRPRGRLRVLESTTLLRFDEDGVELALQRAVILALGSFGPAPRGDRGWLASRAGFAAEAVVERRANRATSVGGWLRGGPSLTLASSEDFSAHLVVGAELTLAAWDATDPVRLGVGPWVELALPVAGWRPLRLRAYGRLTPWAGLAGRGGVEAEARAALDAAVWPARGLELSVDVGWQHGGPAAPAWDARLVVGL